MISWAQIYQGYEDLVTLTMFHNQNDYVVSFYGTDLVDLVDLTFLYDYVFTKEMQKKLPKDWHRKIHYTFQIRKFNLEINRISIINDEPTEDQPISVISEVAVEEEAPDVELESVTSSVEVETESEPQISEPLGDVSIDEETPFNAQILPEDIKRKLANEESVIWCGYVNLIDKEKQKIRDTFIEICKEIAGWDKYLSIVYLESEDIEKYYILDKLSNGQGIVRKPEGSGLYLNPSEGDETIISLGGENLNETRDIDIDDLNNRLEMERKVGIDSTYTKKVLEFGNERKREANIELQNAINLAIETKNNYKLGLYTDLILKRFSYPIFKLIGARLVSDVIGHKLELNMPFYKVTFDEFKSPKFRENIYIGKIGRSENTGYSDIFNVLDNNEELAKTNLKGKITEFKQGMEALGYHISNGTIIRFNDFIRETKKISIESNYDDILRQNISNMIFSAKPKDFMRFFLNKGFDVNKAFISEKEAKQLLFEAFKIYLQNYDSFKDIKSHRINKILDTTNQLIEVNNSYKAMRTNARISKANAFINLIGVLINSTERRIINKIDDFLVEVTEIINDISIDDFTKYQDILKKIEKIPVRTNLLNKYRAEM